MSDIPVNVDDLDPISRQAVLDAAIPDQTVIIGEDDNDGKLTDLEEQIRAEFESRAGDNPTSSAPGGSGASTDAGGEGEVFGSQPETPSDNETGTGAIQAGEATPSGEPSPGEPAPSTIDLTELELTPTEALSALEWLKGLTPEQVARIQQTLNEPAPSAPVNPVATGYSPPAFTPPGVDAGGIPQQQQYQPVQPVQPTQPIPAVGQPGAPITPTSTIPTVPDVGVLGEIVPGLGEFLAAQAQQNATLQQQFNLLQAQEQQRAQSEAQAQMERNQALINQGAEDFKAKYPTLTEQELHNLANRAVNLQIMPQYVQRHNGAVDKAYVEVMETALWSDPTMRDRLTQASLEQQALNNSAIEQRRASAASLSGSNGSVSRVVTPKPPDQMTRQEKDAAMANIIAGSMNGSSN